MNQGDICIVTAFMLEAETFIHNLGLKQETVFREYPTFIGENEGIHYTVLISGLGAFRMAQMIAWAFGKTLVRPSTSIINIGIAGHSNLEFGQIFKANKCVSSFSNETWFPPMVLKDSLIQSSLYCVSKPETDYKLAGGYDMESAGFFSAISKFGIPELCHAFKVVSDNPQNSWRDLNKSEIPMIIEKNISILMPLFKELGNLSRNELDLSTEHPAYDIILKKAHFSKTQQFQLSKLLKRWDTYFPHSDPLDKLGNPVNSKQWLQKLTAKLDFPMPSKFAP